MWGVAKQEKGVRVVVGTLTYRVLSEFPMHL